MQRRVLRLQRFYGMYSRRIQGYGAGNPDSDICMDTESYDRQSCFGKDVAGENGCDRTCEFPPGNYFPGGLFLAFATGTSWGTFGILIPIVVAVFQRTNETMMIISISACMAGAVCVTTVRQSRMTIKSISRSAVQSCKSRIDAAPICYDCGSSIICDLCHCRICTERMDQMPIGIILMAGTLA